VVAVLWVIAFFYYFDRLMLTSMRDAIEANVGMTDAQFGLLTSWFLWVYGLLGPLGGFIADRFGKRRIILASLLMWSIAIWITGHTHSFHELLWSRVLMGVSEACYLPSALALVSDHHRGSTRSLATGLHNSGLYVGAALGGLGGWLAEWYGWRAGFSVLGVAGLFYFAIAAIFLKDAPPVSPAAKAEPVAASQALAELLGNGRFWLLVMVFSFLSIGNWLAYGWMPTFLHLRFNISVGKAGISGTSYLQLSAFVALLAGGIWADRWSRRDPRARAWVAAAGFAISVPGLLLIGRGNLFGLAILGLIFFGIGRGLYDANGMPILRQIAPERYSATGYGLMNLCACAVGGLVTYGGGALLDAKISLTIVFEAVAVIMALGALALLCVIRRGAEAPAAE
jgi:MFS family permease